MEAMEVVEAVTGIGLAGRDIGGRNVWGRVAYRREGRLHVEVLPSDEEVNNAVMRSFTDEEMELDSRDRYKLYRSRCCTAAAVLNEEAVKHGGLVLLISSNGQLSRIAKVLREALL